MERITTAFAGFTALAMTAAAQSTRVEPRTSSFESGGKKIGVEIFETPTTTNGPAPAILVLHGSGGMDYGNKYVRQLATAFATNGYTTLLVHYFDRTGTRYASDDTIRPNFPSWMEAVHDAVTFALAQPKIDPKRIAIFGYSLGAYLAVAQASRDLRVHAVVELAGGIDPEFARSVKQMPPTLIVHGKDDQRVPFKEARALEKFLHTLGTPVVTQFYDGEGHVLSPLAAFDALARGLDFLKANLR
jgi:dipeptidyl aminopeptidase/acylaminoacyl peptidase